MRFDLVSGIGGCARQVLAALAIFSIVGLATPSASAQVTLSYTVDGGASTGLTSGTAATGSGGIGSPTSGGIGYTITATSTDTAASGSSLTTTTIDISNTGTNVETITFVVTGTGYSFNGTATTNQPLLANLVIDGATGSAGSGDTDSITVSSMIQSTSLGSATATLTGPTGGLGANYGSFNPALPASVSATASGGTFSLSQTVSITLNAGDKADLGILSQAIQGTPTTSVVPEPSSVTLLGLGALGMIGFGLRRRNALGA
jgi:hypothetical protein